MKEFGEAIRAGLSVFERKVYAKLLGDLENEFQVWLQRGEAIAQDDPLLPLASFLRTSVEQLFEEYRILKQDKLECNRYVLQARSQQEIEEHVLTYTRRLGSKGREFRRDKQALNRWFGIEALNDRFDIRTQGVERKLSFFLERLGAVSGMALRAELQAHESVDGLWAKLSLETVLEELFNHDGDVRVTVSAFRCLASALRALPPENCESVVRPTTLQYIYRSALQRSLDVWLQREGIRLLSTISPSSFVKVLRKRLEEPAGGDDFLVRADTVGLIQVALLEPAQQTALFSTLLNDPSPFVRQQIPAALAHHDYKERREFLRALTLSDPSPKVRAATLVALQRFTRSLLPPKEIAELLCELFADERDSFVLRTACFISELLVRSEGVVGTRDNWPQKIEYALRDLQASSEHLPVRRYAAQAAEGIWCERTEEAFQLKMLLSSHLSELRHGSSKSIAKKELACFEEDTLGRVLSVMSRYDFGFDVERGITSYRFTRGTSKTFRLWRFFHELFHPAPDKREPFDHTSGRQFYGEITAPSAILAELTETRVPGEPLFLSEEQGWRPFIPLPDAIMSSFNRTLGSRTTKIYTSEGITSVKTPGLIRGLVSFSRLIFRFEKLSKKRNWREGRKNQRADEYVRELRELGIDTRHMPYPSSNGRPVKRDESVSRFFSFAPFSFSTLPDDLWGEFSNYFVSLHDNTVTHLVLFTGAVLALFLWSQSKRLRSLRKARGDIPLVIGGWGTRGKSGTERLKAALFNGLGLGIVSKSTGCEAMIVQSYPFSSMHELPLFRPYDKVSIWEQCDVTGIAGKLHPEVMLWECMALNPRYVEIMQRHWMRDDISTITNAYPDHEDIQGPAGVNVAETISCFVPYKSFAVTSEELMLPILRERADERDTNLKSVGWLEAGLITEDVLERFPYSEHPYNIALVLRMAEYLGIDPTFALKEMADRVIPDLGVLKTFPEASIGGKKLQFTNAMSANERFGCLNSWQRMGFADWVFTKRPGEWLTTIVNNRGDRLPRSRVFARMLVRDLRAHKHFLIGSNLEGLKKFIQEEWDEYAAEIRFWRDSGDSNDQAVKILDEIADSLFILQDEALVYENIQAGLRYVLQDDEGGKAEPSLLDSVQLEKLLKDQVEPDEAQSLLNYLREQLSRLGKYRELRIALLSAAEDSRAAVEEEAREFFAEVFMEKFVVVQDYDATGEELLAQLAELTPPGFTNRLVGVQNIKGTGLDFVYRWLNWEECYRASLEAMADKKDQVKQGLLALAAIPRYGLLSLVMIETVLQTVKNSRFAQEKELQLALDKIEAQLEVARSTQGSQRKSSTDRDQSVLRKTWSMLKHSIRESSDILRSIERSYRAQQIYRDLTTQRICRIHAREELWRLYREQQS